LICPLQPATPFPTLHIDPSAHARFNNSLNYHVTAHVSSAVEVASLMFTCCGNLPTLMNTQ
uniref:Uncharacterized protein n=1 Tax=Amphimedon queenslandica TaxID=400682 RepID=A0A1X7V6Y1_AMPQE